MTDRPNKEDDLMLVFFSVGFMAISSGRVTNFSTSSALRPGHCEMMVTEVLVTSGKASILIFLKLMYPPAASKAVTKNMKNLFLNANDSTVFMNRFMFYIGFFTVVCFYMVFKRASPFRNFDFEFIFLFNIFQAHSNSKLNIRNHL